MKSLENIVNSFEVKNLILKNKMVELNNENIEISINENSVYMFKLFDGRDMYQEKVLRFLEDKYPYLLDPQLINIFQLYSKEYNGKNPNFGTRYLTKHFVSWLAQKPNSQELLNNCKSIMQYNKIPNLIVDLIQTSNLTQTQILEVLGGIGLSFNIGTIQKTAKKYLFNGDLDTYLKRFPKGKHRINFIEIDTKISKEYLIPPDDTIYIRLHQGTFSISPDFIKLMSEIIYDLIKASDKNELQTIFTENLVVEDQLKTYIENLNIIETSFISSPNFKKFFSKVIKDFVVITTSLKKINQKHKGKLLNIKKYCKSLINCKYDLHYPLFTLRTKIIPEIIHHLNQTIPNFNLKMQIRQKLEQDENGKVCGYCGKKKPWKDYYKKPDGSYVSKCKKCASIYGEIIKFRKKLRLLFELYNGKYKSKCSNPNCSVDFLLLPSFEFHHPSDKTYSWRKNLKKNYKDIKKLLENDGVLPLCSNCHALEQQTILLDYENLILNEYLFSNSTQTINKMIETSIETHPNLGKKKSTDPQYKDHAKYMIKSWIRKRAIVEQVYNGGCINCEETYLGSLTFHRVDPKRKDKISSEAFRTYSIPYLAKQVIKEKCVCLCANCHGMITSTIFRDHFEEVFEGLNNIDKIINNVDLFYIILDKNIQNTLKEFLKCNFRIKDYLNELNE